jgi:hypothetical protein
MIYYSLKGQDVTAVLNTLYNLYCSDTGPCGGPG